MIRLARAAAALSLLAALTGCATPPAAPPLDVALPPAPAVMSPVAVPPVREGDDAFVVLAKSRAALGKANARLKASRQWYEGVRSGYAGGAK